MSEFSKTRERVRYQTAGGIPLRLEFAVRFLSAWESSGDVIQAIDKVLKAEGMPDGALGRSLLALEAADTLIQAHNETCGVNQSSVEGKISKAISDLEAIRARASEGESMNLDIELSDIEYDLEQALKGKAE